MKLRAQSVRSVDEVVANAAAGMKIFLETQEPLAILKSRLAEKGRGLVSLVLMGEGGREVELKLPGGYRVTPQIRGAIKSVPGVVEVQEI